MIRTTVSGIGSSHLLPLVLFVLIAVVFGVILSSGSVTSSLAITLGLIVFILAVVKSNIALYFLVLSMLLSPEIGIGGMQEQGVGERSVVIRLDDLFLMLVAFGWLARSAIFKQVGLVLKSPINGQIYAYTASFLIATGAGIIYGDVKPALGLFNCLKFIEYFILFFMVLNNIEDEKYAKRLVNVALFTAFIIALYAIYQIPSGARVSAPFEGESGEPNTLGGYMLFMLCITLAIFLETKNFYRQVFFGFMSILCLVALFYTESRSSYIGLLFSIVFLIYYAKRRNLLVLGIVLTLIFSSVMLPERVIERINYTFKAKESENPFRQTGEIEGIDSSTQARIHSWIEAFNGWKRYPILGWGVTGFTFVDAQYMKILVETGVVGLIAFLLLLRALYRNLRRISNALVGKDEFFRGVALGTYAGFIGLCGHAIGTNTFIIIRIMEPFWLFVGIVISIPQFLPEVRKEIGESVGDEKEGEEAEQEERIRFFT